MKCVSLGDNLHEMSKHIFWEKLRCLSRQREICDLI